MSLQNFNIKMIFEMLKFFKILSVALFVATVLWGCGTHKPETIPVKLPVQTLSDGDLQYNMNLEGTLFLSCHRNMLFKYTIPEEQLDSVALPVDERKCYFNIITSRDHIMLLSFDKDSQYDTSKIRHIKVFKFDYKLTCTDVDSFVVGRGIHLLQEDFNFTNYYYDKKDDMYIINDLYGKCIVVKEHIWNNIFFAKKNVDPLSGTLYDFNDLYHVFLKKFQNKGSSAYKDIQGVKQFSVFKNKILCYNNGSILYGSVLDENIFDFLNKDGFNVCRRFENGTYQLTDNNNLLICKVYK